MINPWEIVSWLGAAAVALLLVSVIVGTVRQMVRPKSRTTPIFRGRRID